MWSLTYGRFINLVLNIIFLIIGPSQINSDPNRSSLNRTVYFTLSTLFKIKTLIKMVDAREIIVAISSVDSLLLLLQRQPLQILNLLLDRIHRN